MESFGSFLDEEWESLSKLFSGDQDSGHFSGYGLSFETPSIVSSVMVESNIANASFVDNFCYSYENVNPNSQETGNNGCFAYESSTLFPYPSSNITSLPNYNGGCDHEPIDFHEEMYNNAALLSHVLSDDSMEEILCLRPNIENSVNLSIQDADQIKRIPAKRKIDQVLIAEDEKPEEDLKKKTRVSRDNKNKKKVQPKKKQKVVDDKVDVKGVDGEDDNNNKVEGNAPIASSSSCGSEEDLNGGATNSNWKTRAGRGAATDPQSLYARKRRERINERLKILQNLVPNGTKVDISTMLEEAVQYVKFLQLQIKLLSSDEMWMYAPIAYNGMDMGLYNNLSQS